MKTIWQPLQTLWRAGEDFLYPPACPLCGVAQERTAEEPDSNRFCHPCRAELLPDDGNRCNRCGAPAGPHLDTSDGCHHCRKDSFKFETVFRLGVYESLMRTVILRMKQRYAVPLTVACADLLYEETADDLAKLAPAAVVPVPRHWAEGFRGQHSPETLAERLAKHLGVPCRPDIVWKTRRTPQQSKLLPTKRRANLRKAFAAELPKKLAEQPLLIVDDVLTTGTTANEVAKVLRKAGAGRIVVAVLARGIGR